MPVLIGLVVLGAMVVGIGLFANRRCAAVAKRMGRAHSYTLITGCMVRTSRGWFRLSAVRDIEGRNR